MASQHIEITGAASRTASDTRSLVDQLRQVQSLAAKVNDVFQQMASGADWVTLGAALGISAENAEIVYNLFVAIQDDLTTADYNAVIDRLG
jgi:hypothetical protein